MNRIQIKALTMQTYSSSLSKAILLSLFFAAAGPMAFGQNATRKEKQAEKAERMKKAVESRDYVFTAQMVLPMSGGTRQLTSYYDVRVSKDTINCYLPYFGRAYSASLDPNDAGIKFVSKDFTYTVTSRQKGGWDISIKPKDAREVEQLTFYISPEGYASLQVMPANKQAISFNGYITGRKKEQTIGQ